MVEALIMSSRNNSETKSTRADNSPRAPLIELSGITKSFGNVDALSGVDLKIGEAESVGIIGDNGAGKSTLVKLLSGVYPATGGTMKFRGARCGSTARLMRARTGSR